MSAIERIRCNIDLLPVVGGRGSRESRYLWCERRFTSGGDPGSLEQEWVTLPGAIREHFTKHVPLELALKRMSRSLSDPRAGRKGIQGMKSLSQGSKLWEDSMCLGLGEGVVAGETRSLWKASSTLGRSWDLTKWKLKHAFKWSRNMIGFGCMEDGLDREWEREQGQWIGKVLYWWSSWKPGRGWGTYMCARTRVVVGGRT